LNKRRTNPFFLSDGEAAREGKLTEVFVRTLATANDYSLKDRLCDSCGVALRVQVWYCKKCNICFCHNCGIDFSHIQKNDFPDCSICGDKLKYEKSLQVINDKQEVLRYIASTTEEAKSIDGLETKWKQGNLKPVDPKKYRRSSQEKC
jgi:hypothetical protein